MKVVNIRLRLEIILIVEFYNTSDGSSFTSVSTYFQKKSSGCLSYNPRSVWMSAFYMGSKTHLSSQRETVVSQDSMGIIPLPWENMA